MADIIDITAKLKRYQATMQGHAEHVLMEASRITEELRDICQKNPEWAAQNLDDLDQIATDALGAEFVARLRAERRLKQ